MNRKIIAYDHESTILSRQSTPEYWPVSDLLQGNESSHTLSDPQDNCYSYATKEKDSHPLNLFNSWMFDLQQGYKLDPDLELEEGWAKVESFNKVIKCIKNLIVFNLQRQNRKVKWLENVPVAPPRLGKYYIALLITPKSSMFYIDNHFLRGDRIVDPVGSENTYTTRWSHKDGQYGKVFILSKGLDCYPKENSNRWQMIGIGVVDDVTF